MSFHARKAPVEKRAPEKPVLGTEVETRCRACRAITKHVVVAKVGAKPTRVRCGTCDLEHEYTITRARRTADAAPLQLPWAEAIARARGTATPYSASASYLTGARVSHASFGEGVVVRVASPTVCEVLFEERTVKLLMKSAPSGFVAPEPRSNVALRRGRRFG
jgi:hypothetical protein